MNYFIKLRSRIFIFIYLIRLLFSSRKKIYENIFETDHIRGYLNDLEWGEIVGKKINNKFIKKSKRKKIETAIVIPGRLRNWEQSSKLIYSLAENSMIFIVTDNIDKEIVKKIKHKNIKIIVIENSIYKKEAQHVPTGSLMQFFKLKCAIDEIYKYEKKNNIFFKYFLKIRTDIYFYNPEDLLNMTKEANENCLFVFKNDLAFSGRREFFLILQNFYEFSKWLFLNNYHNIKYLPTNPYQIIKSDVGSFRFNWLKYPTKIVGKKIIRKVDGFKMKKLIKKNIKEINTYIYNKNDEFKEAGIKNHFFPGEMMLSNFLNLSGIVCKNHKKFMGYLYKDRFYETEIKKKIGNIYTRV
jgi:hypothetical protein